MRVQVRMYVHTGRKEVADFMREARGGFICVFHPSSHIKRAYIHKNYKGEIGKMLVDVLKGMYV